MRACDETEVYVEFESDRRNDRSSACDCGSVNAVAANIVDENVANAKRADGVGCKTSGVSVFRAM